jgi:protein ImuA
MPLTPLLCPAVDGFADAKLKDVASPQLLAALRLHISKLERRVPQLDGAAAARSRPWAFDIAEIDRHLPETGLARRGLHDIAPGAYGDMPAAMGLALALALKRLADPAELRPLLWCRLAREVKEYGNLYGHGLESLGLARHRFVTVTLRKPLALLWVAEEALKSGALALVLADAEPKYAGLTATRRLSLAAQAGKAAGLLVFTQPTTNATASHTRWVAGATRSKPPPDDEDAPGPPAWDVELTRARGGRPGQWLVEWQHAPHRFDLVSGLRDGAIHPWADEKSKSAAAS